MLRSASRATDFGCDFVGLNLIFFNVETRLKSQTPLAAVPIVLRPSALTPTHRRPRPLANSKVSLPNLLPLIHRGARAPSPGGRPGAAAPDATRATDSAAIQTSACHQLRKTTLMGYSRPSFPLTSGGAARAGG